MADSLATESSPLVTERSSDWRNPVALVIVFILAGLFFFVAMGATKPPVVAVTITGIVTNATGAPEVLVELRNNAAEITITSVVQVATSEQYGSTNSFIRFTHNLPNGIPNSRPAWSSQYLEDNVVKYHTVKDFTSLETEVLSSNGTTLSKGEVTTLRFVRPNQSFRLVIDCWQLSTNDTMRRRLERLNAWAYQKLSVPIVLKNTSWAHLQVSTPVISSRGFTNETLLRFIGKPFEFQP